MKMERREFLAVTGAAAAAATLTNRPAAAQPAAATGKKFLKSLKFPMVREDLPIMDKFKLLKEVGFDGVELDSPSDLDKKEVLRARDAVGLPIPGVIDSVHWNKTLADPDPKVRAEGLDGLRTALRDAKEFGASTVLLVPAVVRKNIPYDVAYRRSQEEISKVLPLAHELGVKIAIENVWNQFLLSPLETARYIDDFEDPMIGAYFDIGNVVNFGFPEHWIRVLGHRIMKLDVKEFSRAKRDKEGPFAGFEVEIGEGDCDWPAVLQALNQIGYEGWISAEVRGGDRQRMLEISQRMDKAFGLA